MKSWAYKWQVVASVIFGTFMVIMDATLVNVALPTLRTVFASNGGEASARYSGSSAVSCWQLGS